MSFWGMCVLLAGGLTAYTKPTDESFQKYFDKEVKIGLQSHRPEPTSMLSQCASYVVDTVATKVANVVMTPTIEDWFFFKRATVTVSGGTDVLYYVGVWHKWYPLQRQVQTMTTHSNEKVHSS